MQFEGHEIELERLEVDFEPLERQFESSLGERRLLARRALRAARRQGRGGDRTGSIPGDLQRHASCRRGGEGFLRFLALAALSRAGATEELTGRLRPDAVGLAQSLATPTADPDRAPIGEHQGEHEADRTGPLLAVVASHRRPSVLWSTLPPSVRSNKTRISIDAIKNSDGSTRRALRPGPAGGRGAGRSAAFRPCRGGPVARPALPERRRAEGRKGPG